MFASSCGYFPAEALKLISEYQKIDLLLGETIVQELLGQHQRQMGGVGCGGGQVKKGEKGARQPILGTTACLRTLGERSALQPVGALTGKKGLSTSQPVLGLHHSLSWSTGGKVCTAAHWGPSGEERVYTAAYPRSTPQPILGHWGKGLHCSLLGL